MGIDPPSLPWGGIAIGIGALLAIIVGCCVLGRIRRRGRKNQEAAEAAKALAEAQAATAAAESAAAQRTAAVGSNDYLLGPGPGSALGYKPSPMTRSHESVHHYHHHHTGSSSSSAPAATKPSPLPSTVVPMPMPPPPLPLPLQTTGYLPPALPPSAPASPAVTTRPPLPAMAVPGEPWTALWDYAPQAADELAVRRGDTVVVLEAFDDAWARCRHAATGNIGFIPLTLMARGGAGGGAGGAMPQAPRQQHGPVGAYGNMYQHQRPAGPVPSVGARFGSMPRRA
ncbi:hypothetical protein H9P43_004889 [Blastocladiella emersonii ATCC 22665]|nr:hypothetical protein H9P43_004889 [Blastocladiella emersonii ATCC 22665]